MRQNSAAGTLRPEVLPDLTSNQYNQVNAIKFLVLTTAMLVEVKYDG